MRDPEKREIRRWKFNRKLGEAALHYYSNNLVASRLASCSISAGNKEEEEEIADLDKIALFGQKC